MKSLVIKRSIVIAGHKTSISLEDAFWTALKDIALAQRTTLSDLVATIDSQRRHGNLSSAIRLFVLEHFQARRESTANEGPANNRPANNRAGSANGRPRRRHYSGSADCSAE